MNISLKQFATSLPYPLKQGLKYAYGAIPLPIRYGKVFRETYAFLQESQWWSREQLEAYQLEQLSKLLHHAYENVPYYRRMFKERGLKPKDIQDFKDLQMLPYLTKDDFKKHFKELVATNVNLKNLPMSHTSGSSGKPLQFYTSRTIGQKELAFIFHQWSRVGYEPGDSRVEIRGAIIGHGNPVEFNPASKVLRLSPRVDNMETAKYYLQRIKKIKSNFIHGYPSAIASFAHIIKKHDISVPFQLKAVLFASEAVYDWERAIVGDVFNCRVFSFYGMAEQVVLAAECEYSSCYHCLPQYGITEIDPKTNEIIGTSFLNYINPFIRYRTTDIASALFHRCDHCGREYYPIIEKVEGRIEDYIVTSQGMVGPAIITHPFKDLKTIKDTQIIQKSVHLIILRVVPWDKKESLAYKTEVEQLSRNLQKILGDDMRIEIEKTEEIERTKSGKFKWIVSEVSKDMLEKGLEGVE
jgi:phenylacetate-CoA ligase